MSDSHIDPFMTRAEPDVPGDCVAEISELKAQLAHAQAEATAMRDALEDVFDLIDDGFLVRDVSKDGDPLWALNSIRFVTRLKSAYDVLAATFTVPPNHQPTAEPPRELHHAPAEGLASSGAEVQAQETLTEERMRLRTLTPAAPEPPTSPRGESPADHARQCHPFCSHVVMCRACLDAHWVCEAHKADPDGSYSWKPRDPEGET